MTSFVLFRGTIAPLYYIKDCFCFEFQAFWPITAHLQLSERDVIVVRNPKILAVKRETRNKSLRLKLHISSSYNTSWITINTKMFQAIKKQKNCLLKSVCFSILYTDPDLFLASHIIIFSFSLSLLQIERTSNLSNNIFSTARPMLWIVTVLAGAGQGETSIIALLSEYEAANNTDAATPGVESGNTLLGHDMPQNVHLMEQWWDILFGIRDH